MTPVNIDRGARRTKGNYHAKDGFARHEWRVRARHDKGESCHAGPAGSARSSQATTLRANRESGATRLYGLNAKRIYLKCNHWAASGSDWF